MESKISCPKVTFICLKYAQFQRKRCQKYTQLSMWGGGGGGYSGSVFNILGRHNKVTQLIRSFADFNGWNYQSNTVPQSSLVINLSANLGHINTNSTLVNLNFGVWHYALKLRLCVSIPFITVFSYRAHNIICMHRQFLWDTIMCANIWRWVETRRN